MGQPMEESIQPPAHRQNPKWGKVARMLSLDEISFSKHYDGSLASKLNFRAIYLPSIFLFFLLFVPPFYDDLHGGSEKEHNVC